MLFNLIIGVPLVSIALGAALVVLGFPVTFFWNQLKSIGLPGIGIFDGIYIAALAFFLGASTAVPWIAVWALFHNW